MFARFFIGIGTVVLAGFTYVGELVILAAESVRSALTHRMRWRLFLRQIVDIGLLSQLVVIITGGFTGAVFAAQTYFQFNKLGVASGVGAVVSAALFRELGPVLTGLMVTGRVGAAMSAEIGTMKVTEQIDALRALAVHPVDYLVVPRMLAMMISMPLLVAECIFFGLIASYFVGVYVLDISGPYYVANMVRWTLMRDIIMGLTKGFFFAFLIVFVSCHKGLTSREGAVGVGRATTEAVVNASLAILIFNFFLTMFLNVIFSRGMAVDVTSPPAISAETADATTMIAVRGLTKRIGTQEILRGVDISVGQGETLVIIGRSGGGKSVLLKNLIGLMKPDEGEIWIDGQNITGLSERQLAGVRRKVGILFQAGALFDSMTVEENIAFPLREAGERDPRVLEQKIAEILEVIELEGQQRKMPVNLSGGMKKRVGLARAIINRPSCILYDEPTAGLDPVVSDSINRLIRRLQEHFRVTSIVVTHDMKSAFHVGDRIAYLHEGRIYFYGTPEEIQASSDPLIQDFLIGRATVAD